jgi:hypothetical protein
MPMFFFDLTDDGAPSSPDIIGTDLFDKYWIPEEAQALLASVARDRLPNGLHRDFSVSVRDEFGQPVFVATLSMQARWK